ncbi:hypothetical protein KFU94_25445 [Chloroflexi bacterium TSY]|nr:hypothetical protein [Chloroflexi bacterium TSY]
MKQKITWSVFALLSLGAIAGKLTVVVERVADVDRVEPIESIAEEEPVSRPKTESFQEPAEIWTM